MDRGYDLDVLNKYLQKKFRSTIRPIKGIPGQNNFISPDNKKPVTIYTREGEIIESELGKISKILAKSTGEKPEELKENIIQGAFATRVKNLERISATAFGILAVGLFFLVLIRANLFTGYAISNIPNTTSNIGIFVCVVGILGLMYWKNRCKR